MTPTQAKLLARLERRAAHGGTAPTRAELAAVCAMVREFDAELTQADRETRYVGSTVRLIDVLVERVIAGDSPKSVCEDYGWEWNHGPDLAPLVALVRLRDELRAFVAPRSWGGAMLHDWKRVLRALKRTGGARR